MTTKPTFFLPCAGVLLFCFVLIAQVNRQKQNRMVGKKFKLVCILKEYIRVAVKMKKNYIEKRSLLSI